MIMCIRGSNSSQNESSSSFSWSWFGRVLGGAAHESPYSRGNFVTCYAQNCDALEQEAVLVAIVDAVFACIAFTIGETLVSL